MNSAIWIPVVSTLAGLGVTVLTRLMNRFLPPSLDNPPAMGTSAQIAQHSPGSPLYVPPPEAAPKPNE